MSIFSPGDEVSPRSEFDVDRVRGFALIVFLLFLASIVYSFAAWITSIPIQATIIEERDVVYYRRGNPRTKRVVVVTYRNLDGFEVQREINKSGAPDPIIPGAAVEILVHKRLSFVRWNSIRQFTSGPLLFGALSLASIVVLLIHHRSRGGGMHVIPPGAVNEVRDAIAWIFSSKHGRKNFRGRVFLEAVFSMLAKLAAGDGRISEPEIMNLEEFMNSRLRLTEHDRRFAIKIFRDAAGSRYSFEEYARLCERHYHSDPEMLSAVFKALEQLALADGTVTNDEQALLDKADRIFFGTGTDYGAESFFSRGGSGGDPENPAFTDLYRILEVPASISDKELKSAYRKLVFRLHPDRLRARGLPEGMYEEAADKFRKVQEAYEKICAERGLS